MLGKVGIEGVPGEDGSGLRIDPRDDVHGRPVPAFAEYPLAEAGDAESPRPVGNVPQPDDRELDRHFDAHVDERLREELILGMLERRVAEAVTAEVGIRSLGGGGGGRPESSRLFVADVESLSAGVADRVVVPGRKAELVGVLVPGISAARFADHRAEERIGQHVDPGRGGRLARVEPHHVLAAVGSESPQAVETGQLALGNLLLAGDRPLPLQRRPKLLLAAVLADSAVELRSQAAESVAENDAGDRLDEELIFLGHLFDIPHEDAAVLIQQLSLRSSVDQADDGVQETLPVAGQRLGPDDQVHAQALVAPVGVCLNERLRQTAAPTGRSFSTARWAGRRKCRSSTGRAAPCGSARSSWGRGGASHRHRAANWPTCRRPGPRPGRAASRAGAPGCGSRPCQTPGPPDDGPGTCPTATRPPPDPCRRR